MKIALRFFVAVTFLAFAKVFGQLPNDFPFKTFLDAEDNIYITGYNSNLDIETRKFLSNGSLSWKKYLVNEGFDRATDLFVIEPGYVFLSGFLYDGITQKHKLCFIKHIADGGEIEFTKVLNYENESKGFGITSNETEFYISGYVTNPTNKDLIVICYTQSGDTLWTRTYDNPDHHKDDAGTDILIDRNFIYVIGNTYNGPFCGNDVFQYVCGLDGSEPQVSIVRGKYTNDIPTSFIIAEIPDSPPVQKSRTAVGVMTDNSTSGSGTQMRTYYFKDNSTTQLQWSRTYAGSPGSVSVPASLGADENGNVYVAGYTNTRSRSNYDFLTTRYNKEDGSDGWNNPAVLYYDSLNGNDKASSVKVSGNKLMVAGTSDSTQNGYYIAVYGQIQATPVKEFDGVFVPSFSESGPIAGTYNKHSTVEVDSSGNIYLIAQMWNETEAYFAVRKYSPAGEILYTIDPFEGRSGRGTTDGSETITNNSTEIQLFGNYPNPFNPTTVISYSISAVSEVTLRIYDTSGRLVRDVYKGVRQPGEYTQMFDANGLSSGIYHAVLTTNGRSSQIRMVLVK